MILSTGLLTISLRPHLRKSSTALTIGGCGSLASELLPLSMRSRLTTSTPVHMEPKCSTYKAVMLLVMALEELTAATAAFVGVDLVLRMCMLMNMLILSLMLGMQVDRCPGSRRCLVVRPLLSCTPLRPLKEIASSSLTTLVLLQILARVNILFLKQMACFGKRSIVLGVKE